ncbi:MAG: S-layer homology domain-containing protein [Clostridia bacterium]|nr:S-layer homology domain-containing protein [Clostridia bacterium]
MRRLISFISVAILTMTTAFAAPTVIPKDAANNIITIADTANDGDIVSLVIANSGYDTGDILASSDSALQFFDSTEAVDGKYSFDVKINNDIGNNGTYSAIVNVAGAIEKFTFRFYSYDEKLNIINAINSAADVSDLLNRYSPTNNEKVIIHAIKAYDLDSADFWNDANVNDVAKIIFCGKGTGYDNDADAMYDILKSSIYVAALNASSAKAFNNNVLAHPELIGLDTSGNIYNDYSLSLNSKGVDSVKSAIIGSDFISADEAKTVFEEAVILNLITNNVKYGNGHVQGVIEKYESRFESAGFKLSRLKSIKNISDLYDELSSAKVSTLSELAVIFNGYDDKSNNSSSTTGGLNHGSMSSNAGSLPTYIPSEVDTPAAISFADIQSAAWAQEAIEALAKLGIVNGKGNGVFDPDGSVTRAEFTKMIVGATGLVDNAAECSFSDVNSHWAYAYIASAFKHGIVSGTGDNIYSPDSVITREQGATIIYRALISLGNKLSAEANGFSDSYMLSDWASEAVNALAAEGIINGKGDNMFSPKDTLTRAEAAKIIYSTMNLFLSEQEG